jgi:hypothetical protein
VTLNVPIQRYTSFRAFEKFWMVWDCLALGLLTSMTDSILAVAGGAAAVVAAYTFYFLLLRLPLQLCRKTKTIQKR